MRSIASISRRCRSSVISAASRDPVDMGIGIEVDDVRNWVRPRAIPWRSERHATVAEESSARHHSRSVAVLGRSSRGREILSAAILVRAQAAPFGVEPRQTHPPCPRASSCRQSASRSSRLTTTRSAGTVGGQMPDRRLALASRVKRTTSSSISSASSSTYETLRVGNRQSRRISLTAMPMAPARSCDCTRCISARRQTRHDLCDCRAQRLVLNAASARCCSASPGYRHSSSNIERSAEAAICLPDHVSLGAAKVIAPGWARLMASVSSVARIAE